MFFPRFMCHFSPYRYQHHIYAILKNLYNKHYTYSFILHNLVSTTLHLPGLILFYIELDFLNLHFLYKFLFQLKVLYILIQVSLILLYMHLLIIDYFNIYLLKTLYYGFKFLLLYLYFQCLHRKWFLPLHLLIQHLFQSNEY